MRRNRKSATPAKLLPSHHIPFEESTDFKSEVALISTLSLEWTKCLRVMIPTSIVYSPLFLRSLVSITLPFAGNKTAAQISEGLKIPEALESFYRLQKKIEAYCMKFNNHEKHNFLMVSKCLFIERGFDLSPSFMKTFRTFFADEELKLIDFANPIEAARFINSWFSEKLENHVIVRTVSNKSLNSYTRLLPIGSIYFCGNWSKPFPLKNTMIGPFQVSMYKKVEVQMMNQGGQIHHGYFKAIDAEGIAIPYFGDVLYLVILVPKTGRHLDNLRFHGIPFPILDFMKQRLLNIFIPKFTIRAQVHMMPLLCHLGMREMFDPKKSDFSKITDYDANGLYVSEVIQSVLFEVNEGVLTDPDPSIAVTKSRPAYNVMARRKPERMSTFRVDHPFVFQVIQKETGMILFEGTCSDPTV